MTSRRRPRFEITSPRLHPHPPLPPLTHCSAFIAFTILGAAAAFAPLGRTSRRASLCMNGVEDLPGISGPFGFFDPAGFSNGKTEGEIIKWRESELKVGRDTHFQFHSTFLLTHSPHYPPT